MNPVVLAVDDLREQYLKEMALVRQTCERTGDGTAAIRRRSAVVDRILIEMWRRAFAGLPPQNVALLALGGYGRKDLFPYSDIDVLFAFADEKTEEQSREAVRAIIQGMWDIGLRASPSSRTVKESGRFDPDNLEFTLATLDRRFLAGQFPLYQQLHQVTFPGLVLSEWNTITQKLGEIARTRHAKYGNTIFHLEPNLKDCPGGLRDYSSCRLVRRPLPSQRDQGVAAPARRRLPKRARRRRSGLRFPRRGPMFSPLPPRPRRQHARLAVAGRGRRALHRP